jgi:hypothetical protein
MASTAAADGALSNPPNSRCRDHSNMGMRAMLPRFFIIADVVILLAGAVFFHGEYRSREIDRKDCHKVIADYTSSFDLSDADGSIRARYVHCYYIICGIRLNG